MESYLNFADYDLVTPDGKLVAIEQTAVDQACVEIRIENISPCFRGYFVKQAALEFNFKSTLAQLGLNATTHHIEQNLAHRTAIVTATLQALTPEAEIFLPLLRKGAFIGKLFAADPQRLVRSTEYLTSMFDRSDDKGRPLLWLGDAGSSSDLSLEIIDGRVVAFISVQPGYLDYGDSINGFLPTLAEILCNPTLKSRAILQLHQRWQAKKAESHKLAKLILVRTAPLHVRTVFARIVDSLLPNDIFHTTANVLEPDTQASGNIYELFGKNAHSISRIPLEFYTLEPHREYTLLQDGKSFANALAQPMRLFQAFESTPAPKHALAATFVVNAEQLEHLKPDDWIAREPKGIPFPGIIKPEQQSILAHSYLQQQPSFPFLEAIEKNCITSQGILLSRYFPSPLLKQKLLSEPIARLVKRIYFQYPSLSHGNYFSNEDRSFLIDLAKFGIPVFWVDESFQQVLQFVPKPGKDSGMFVSPSHIDEFMQATFFGIYGSNLITPQWEKELTILFEGLLKLQKESLHSMFNAKTPMAIVTGGGPAAMSLGNKIARSLNILSCANIMDFRGKKGSIINEQKQNPYIDAKMTYRLEALVERQAEFRLDFPIFFQGGIGTDFEYTLEEVRRKVGACPPTPIILTGNPEYWRQKITSRFQCNLQSGTISDSEWISNCFYCTPTAEAALKVYRQFFRGSLNIGTNGPIYRDGFAIIED